MNTLPHNGYWMRAYDKDGTILTSVPPEWLYALDVVQLHSGSES